MISSSRRNHLNQFLTQNQLHCSNLELLDIALYFSHHQLKEKIKQRLRLELLGDSIWNFLIVNFIFKRYPNKKKSFLANLKAFLVSKTFLSSLAQQINLFDYIIVQDEQPLNLKNKSSILEDTYESLIGAFYLSEGLPYLQTWHYPLLNLQIKEIEKKVINFNQKTILQEKLHQHKITPRYLVEKVEGPPHEKKYTVSLYIKGEKIASGIGSSIKKAQTDTALLALKNLNQFLEENKT